MKTQTPFREQVANLCNEIEIAFLEDIEIISFPFNKSSEILPILAELRHAEHNEILPILDRLQSMLNDNFTLMIEHLRSIYPYAQDTDSSPELPELPKNCRLISLEEARAIKGNKNGWCIEGGLLGYRYASSTPDPVAGTEWVFFGDERFGDKETLLLISSKAWAEISGSLTGDPF